MVEVELKGWGNSTGVIIPKELLDSIGAEQGEIVDIAIKKKKYINGFGISKGIGPFKRERNSKSRDYK